MPSTSRAQQRSYPSMQPSWAKHLNAPLRLPDDVIVKVPSSSSSFLFFCYLLLLSSSGLFFCSLLLLLLPSLMVSSQTSGEQAIVLEVAHEHVIIHLSLMHLHIVGPLSWNFCALVIGECLIGLGAVHHSICVNGWGSGFPTSCVREFRESQGTIVRALRP